MAKFKRFIFTFIFLGLALLLYAQEPRSITKTAADAEKNKKQILEFYNKGKDREAKGNYSEALKEYGEIFKIDKTYYPVYKNIGNCFLL